MRSLAEICTYLALIGLIHAKVVINSTTLSTERSSVGSSAIQSNKILFAGGFEFNDKISSNVIDVYNLDTNSWEPPLTLQNPRANLNLAVLGGLTYFIGGHEYTNKPYVYNESAVSFTQLPTDPPSVRTVSALSLHNTTSTLTVLGKWNIDFLDITSGTWNSSQDLNNIMASLVGPLVLTSEEYIFIIGGRNSTDQISETLYIYNIDTNQLLNKTISLQIYSNPTQPSQILHNFKNDVLLLSQNTTTVLYHAVLDELYHLDIEPLYLAVSQPNLTYMFPASKTAVYLFRWANTSAGYEKLYNDTFLFAFGTDQVVGYVWKLAVNSVAMTLNIDRVVGTSSSINWGGDVTGYNWGSNRYVFADNQTVLVINFDSMLNQPFKVGQIKKIFPVDDTVYLFVEGPGAGCTFYTITESIADYTKTSFICYGIPDLIFNSRFFYLANGLVSSKWPFLIPMAAIPPMNNTADLLVVQTADQLILMHQTPDIKLSGIIEVLNTTNNDTWLDPITMPSQLLDGENNIVVISLNDTVLAFFDTSVFRINSSLQQELIDSAGYSVIGNRFDYMVHSQVAAIIGNDAYMKSKNNSQWLLVYNDETGWRNTAPFPEIAVIEPKQLFVHNNKTIYMIAKDLSANAFNNVYWYDIASESWQITLYKSYSSVTAVMIGDFLALFADDGIMYSLHIPTGLWIQEDIGNTFLFSSVVQVPSRGLTFVSGAVSFVDGRYSNTVLILTDDGTVPVVPVSPINEPSTLPASSPEDNTTLIVAIVVPVGVVVIAGGLLTFFLVRRNKVRKHGNASSAVGLEAKYGQWFTPFDQIKFGESIGQGANGQVFKGTWKNTTVALKVSMAQANSAVIGELELMMQMRPHPNVVQLFGFSVHPETDSIILIIEYCNQGSLDHTLFDNLRPISIDEKIKWIASAAQGLLHLHSNNIVHRDVAARNILLHQNEPKITDFGMSRLVDDENQRGTTKSELGPIRWMAPEALRSKEYSTKSDVWSFGILMYEIIAQQEPHSEGDPIEVGRLIRDSGLTPVIPESCPTKLASIMKQCWNMNPEQRPSIDQLLRQLEEN